MPEKTSQSDSATKPSEPDYLAQQAQAAQAALRQAWGEFTSKLGHGVDPKAWAKQHPWMTVGGAVVAGFAATAAVVPSKEQQVLRKLSELERALHPPTEKREDSGEKKEKGGLIATILLEAFALLRPVITSILSAQFGATQPPSESQPEENGHSAPGTTADPVTY